MPKCPNCHNEINPNTSFCIVCGTPLKKVQQPIQQPVQPQNDLYGSNTDADTNPKKDYDTIEIINRNLCEMSKINNEYFEEMNSSLKTISFWTSFWSILAIVVIVISIIGVIFGGSILYNFIF